MVDDNINEPATQPDSQDGDQGQGDITPPQTQPDGQPQGTDVEPQGQPATGDSVEKFGLSDEDYQKVMNDPTLSKYYKSMQSDYNKKTEALKQGTKPKTFAEMMQDPQYMQQAIEWAQQNTPPDTSQFQQSIMQYYQNWNKLNENQRNEFLGQLDEGQRLNFMTALQQRDFAIKQAQSDIEKEDAANIQKYGDSYKKLLNADNGINRTIVGIKKGQIPLSAELVYKALDYDNYGKRMLEQGRNELMKNRGNANNANLNRPTGTSSNGQEIKGSVSERILAAINKHGDNVPEVFR